MTVAAVTLAAFAVIVALIALGYASQNSTRADRKAVRQLTLEVADLRELYDYQLDKMRRLSSRVGMRNARRKGGRRVAENTDSDIPDPKVDPVGWKAAMRQRLNLTRAHEVHRAPANSRGDDG